MPSQFFSRGQQKKILKTSVMMILAVDNNVFFFQGKPGPHGVIGPNGAQGETVSCTNV